MRLVIESRGNELVGDLDYVSKDSLVILAHGALSSRHRQRFFDCAKEHVHQGISFFRFSFCGSDDSTFESILVKNQVTDLGSVIDYFYSEGYKKIGLIGESLAGIDSIYLNHPHVDAMVLWAPVTADEAFCTEDELQKINDDGFYIKEKCGKTHTISKEYINEVSHIDSSALEKILLPTLIIHGTKDESVPYSDSEHAVMVMKQAKLYLIDGSGHKFEGYEKELVEKTTEFFVYHLTN